MQHELGEIREGATAVERPPRMLAQEFARRISGWTLLELVITVTVLTILTLGVMPLVQNSVKRQREERLRGALREMREAINEFRRDTVGLRCAGGTAVIGGQPGAQPGQPGQPNQPQQAYIDPRSRVMITDCTIFEVENPDRYPPTLEALVEGVNVISREAAAQAMTGSVPSSGRNATDNPLSATQKKVYLRAIPVDPMTGLAEWDLRSAYDEADAASWGGQNIFDVRSRSRDTALNGERYSDW